MRVNRVRISNILGIDYLEIEPGEVTVIKGQNGTGKTSVISALKAVMRGGHQATLLRKGALVGEVVLVMDNGMEIRKRVTEGRSSLAARHPAYGKLQGAATWLKSAVDQLTVNPVAFLTAPNRADLLLQAMPLEKDEETLTEVLERFELPIPVKLEQSDHALTAIAAVREVVYKERTVVNRVAREAKASVNQLKGSLPDPADTPAEDDLQGMEVALARSRKLLSDDLHDAESKATKRRHTVELTAEERKREIERRAAEELAKIDQWLQGNTDEIQSELDEERANLRVAHEPGIGQQVADLSAARERVRVARQHENTRAIMADHQTTADEKTAQGDALTAALNDLDELKSRQLADLPVDGLEVTGKDITLNGIPFATLNRAEQVRLAVEVAKLRKGDIPLVCLDGMEALDAERFQLLTDALKKEGIQAIVTTVSDDPNLQVVTA